MDTNDVFGSFQASTYLSFQKLGVFLSVSCLAFLLASLGWKSGSQPLVSHSNEATTIPKTKLNVPFILIRGEAGKHPVRIVQKSLEKYKFDTYQALKGLSEQMEQAMELERGLRIHETAKLSRKIHERIKNLSDLFDLNERAIGDLLSSVEFTTSLPDSRILTTIDTAEKSSQWCSIDGQNSEKSKTPPISLPVSRRNLTKQLESNVYDMAAQIIAHLVRDWSTAGSNIRKSLYGWVCQQLIDRSRNRRDPVLVPGAGLGRLAFDIYSNGFTVEANEISPVMATAAKSVLTRNVSGVVYPFVLDAMTNEVDSSRRYDKVFFPDVPVVDLSDRVSLSFTVGDFVGEYYSKQASVFGAVTTCFFIDTATDIYEYITLIKNLLKPKGIWVNVGPIQWHANALLRPSADELKELIVAFGFKIATWSVDEKPVPYREDATSEYDDAFVRSTSFDGYRPLRFVAIRQ